MKLNKILLPVVASAMLLTGCKDQIMEWGKPDGHTGVTKSEIPLAVKEVLANYDDIKVYSAENHPNMVLGLGIGKDIYMGDDVRHGLATGNFQMVTWGNAMKMDAMVSNTGALNTAALEPALDALKADEMDLWGHNFFWHTQQNQTYLKSLIKPTLVVESDSDIKNQLAGDDSDFEGGTKGHWGSWGNGSSSDVAEGGYAGSKYALHLTNPKDANFWNAQCAFTFDTPLPMDVEYTLRFKAKSSAAAGQLQFQYQNGSTYGSQGGYNTFDIGTSWATYEFAFTITNYDDVNRIIFNFGKVGGEYWIDDIEFGIQAPSDPMDNILVGDDSDFEGSTTGKWSSWGNSSSRDVAEQGHSGSKSMHLNNPSDANFWSAQCAYDLDGPLQQGKKYIIQFYAKSSSAAGQLQFQYQNGSTYGSQGGYTTFDVGNDWTLCEAGFTVSPDDANRIIINFGKVGADYYIDDIKFGLAKDQSTAAARMRAARRAKSYYVIKTPEEKRTALLGAMESWVKNMAAFLKEKEITPVGYDVINEAIADGNNKVRGVDNVFGGSDGDGNYDQEPTESVADGLELNWASNHFYWGYYVKDYAVKAFEYARQYLPAETKLFYNDYNLETSDAKRAAAIKFVQDIDAAHGSAIVDGIGTQMHITLSGTSDNAANNAEKVAALRAQVDKQFKELAATGKLIRITELDISLGTSSPSSAQYKAQSDAYLTIFESYFENVPEAQQSGITIWSLTDADDEHEYWLKDQRPNLFDAAFLRKWAYKGVCDALAGEDLGLKFGGETYKTYYEKQNVSDTVK